MFIFSILLMSTSASAKANTKPVAVSANSISFVDVTDDYQIVTFKWKKVKGAKGYQVRIIDSDKYVYSKKIKVYNKMTSKRNRIQILCPNKSKCRNGYFVQVRAYTIKANGKKLYGKWSTSKNHFLAFIY